MRASAVNHHHGCPVATVIAPRSRARVTSTVQNLSTHPMFTNASIERPPASSYSGSTFYDSGVIEKFADRLYSRAASIVLFYVLLGLLVGAVAGFAVKTETRNDIAGWITVVVTVALAYYLGQQRAFQLRLQAQIALCQVQIEKNTQPAPVR